LKRVDLQVVCHSLGWDHTSTEGLGIWGRFGVGMEVEASVSFVHAHVVGSSGACEIIVSITGLKTVVLNYLLPKLEISLATRLQRVLESVLLCGLQRILVGYLIIHHL
jgi:hypothetical protein